MEIEVAQDRVMTIEVERVATDKQVLVAGESQHGVARANTDQTLIGLDPDDSGVEVMARPAIPRGKKRRVEVDAVVADDDALDLQGAAPQPGLVKTVRASWYLAAVFSAIWGGSSGAGGFLSQPTVSR